MSSIRSASIFCHGLGGDLRAIVCKSTTPSGNVISYVLPAVGSGIVRHSTPKTLTFPPFMALDMTYDFRVLPPTRIASSSPSLAGMMRAC
jgi:DUF1365 family protein